MSREMAGLIVVLAGAYAGVGIVVAIALQLALGAFDAATRKSPIAFRLLIFPGLCALWPWMLGMWVARRRAEQGA